MNGKKQCIFLCTFVSDFCWAWGTMIGSSSLAVKTSPRLPKVKTVDLFFKAGLELKKPDYMIRKSLSIFWFTAAGNFLISHDTLTSLLTKCFWTIGSPINIVGMKWMIHVKNWACKFFFKEERILFLAVSSTPIKSSLSATSSN